MSSAKSDQAADNQSLTQLAVADAELDFENFPFDNDDLRIVAACNGSTLRSIRLPWCTAVTHVGISVLSKASVQLQHLDLTGVPAVNDR